MTLDNAAWAINGVPLGSALARRAVYSSGAKQGGVVLPGDLKVTELGTPGVGVQIAPGVANILNGYQTAPNETYVISNPGVHTITSEQMPTSSASARSFLLAIVIGDPDFSQAGHPWMPSTGVPSGEETTFQYVRATLIPVASGATTAPAGYPALPLARIDIPPNTTTITQGMIIDLRSLSQPRQSNEMKVSPQGQYANINLTSAAMADWGTWQPQVKVPSWAKRALLVTTLSSVGVPDTSANVTGQMRSGIGTLYGVTATYDEPVGTGSVRESFVLGGELDVSGVAGQTLALKLQGLRSTGAGTNQCLRLLGSTMVIHDIRFFEV